MALLLMASTVVVMFSAALGAIKVPTVLPENSLNLLQDGIDRICNVTSFGEILVLNDESPDSDGSGLLLPFVNWHRPVTIINSSYATRQAEGKPCIVGFFTSSVISKIARRHLELFVKWIAVLPEDLVANMRKATEQLFKCVMYYFVYDRATLEGRWSVEQNGQWFRGLDLTGSAVTGEGDLMGRPLTFLSVDAERDMTYDVEIGETIAKRHNGTFTIGLSMAQCNDYMYSPMYASILGKLVTLPEMFYMCVLVPKSAQKSIFSTLLDPFDSYTWLAVVLAVGFVSIVLSVFGESYRRHNFLVNALELLMIAIHGPTHTTFEGRFELRIVGLFMVMGIVLTSCYQSLVISFMSAARFDPDLDTLEQINDTCQFQWNLHLRSMGFKFKHEFNYFREVDTPELMWQDKVCSLVPCHDLIMDQSYITRSELDGLEEYNRRFRFAKARLRPSVVMYLIFHATPMQNLISRYSMAFFEAHLHHYPVLRMRREKALGDGAIHDAQNVVATSANDLLIVWIIYLFGCLLSGALFVLEVLAVCIPRMGRFFRGKVGKKSVW